MDDATFGGLVVEPQNHPTTISMGLVSKPGCVISEEIRGGMWSHRGWYIKAKQLRERSMFVKSSKLELVHFITSCVDKFYVFRRYVGNLKIPLFCYGLFCVPVVLLGWHSSQEELVQGINLNIKWLRCS
jgi:hypothetical protein